MGAASPGAMAPGSGSAGGSGDDAPLPPEVEVKLDFEQPQASEDYVYAANPESGTVSIIDAQTLAIQTLETGDRPTFLRTLAGSNDAIVLNVGSQDATIIRSPERGVRTVTAQVVRGANAIAVAPDGKHAIVYFNSSFSTAGNASGSFQDVTVIQLEAPQDAEDGDAAIAVGMTVGFRPRDVFFSADSSRAYVVTDDGISVLDFAAIETEGTGIARLVSLGPDVDQASLDVSVTPDGRYALTRQPGQSVVRLVDLQSGAIRSVDLAAALPAVELDDEVDGGVDTPRVVDVTDLDLAPTGAFALAVVRDWSAVLEIPVPGGFEDEDAIQLHVVPDEIIGSVTITPAADRALLYTTAAAVERITILTLDGSVAPKTVALRKTVEAVAVAPDGSTGLIIHKKDMGDPAEAGISTDQMIDRSYGYSVLRIATGDVKLQVTPTPPGVFTMVPDGSYLFVLFRAEGVREVQKIEAKSFLVDPIPLGSPPISLGAVAQSKRVFVNQEHPDGRITFIDWETSDARTVTGFELNSRIQD